MTSELNERRWAVLSERGCEESGLSYAEASALVARLRGERVSGLCVVTGEAASHVRPAKRAAAGPPPGNSKAAPAASKPRRGRKKTS